ncbi:hypothetical protein DAEQUDRAFT_761557 [Daedalea quercina L-15889]|uniref:Uncharacterized protein n=1 Tax=Daedalea quercina L-15889 TaxID=1314783 RepID=A0A165TXU6_9APHY|nr:hypothetical protein DAEQUDRAFT_761557 [Daedalea quercina L-15889]
MNQDFPLGGSHSVIPSVTVKRDATNDMQSFSQQLTFGHLLESPPTDMVIWQLPSDIVAYDLKLEGETSPVMDLGTAISESDALTLPPPVVIEVPVLDWSTPGVPTVKAPKVKNAKSDSVFKYDFYIFTHYRVPANSTFDLKSLHRPSLPTAPDDMPPRMGRYEELLMRFERLCMKKGMPPEIGEFKAPAALTMWFWVLVYTLWDMVLLLKPIP